MLRTLGLSYVIALQSALAANRSNKSEFLEELPVVLTASRLLQPLTEVPVTMSAIATSTMKFLASPAIAVKGYASYPRVVQVRNSDTTNVIVHQPAACGEREPRGSEASSSKSDKSGQANALTAQTGRARLAREQPGTSYKG